MDRPMLALVYAQVAGILGPLITLIIVAVVLAAVIHLVSIWIPLPPAVSSTAWLLFGVVVVVLGLRLLLGLIG